MGGAHWARVLAPMDSQAIDVTYRLGLTAAILHGARGQHALAPVG